MTEAIEWPEAVGLDEYQQKASATAIYPNFLAVVYPTIKMGGESGEALEKVGKWLRGDTGPLDKEALMMEYGDVLWYIANGLKDLGYTLSECANANLKKVYQRKQQGLTKGSGDNRHVIATEVDSMIVDLIESMTFSMGPNNTYVQQLDAIRNKLS